MRLGMRRIFGRFVPRLPNPITPPARALVAISLAACFAATSAGTLVEDAVLEHGGISRYYDYYVPSFLPRAPVPLVFILHGGTDSNKALLRNSSAWAEWPTIADREKFVLVLPNGTLGTTGTSGPDGPYRWNDCRADGPGVTADDAGFVSALIDWADGEFAIDSQRIYAAGWSNGGMMAYRLALEYSDRFAAVAAVAANLPLTSDCAEPGIENPASILIMNGTSDYWMPWNGGQVIGFRGGITSATYTRDFWKRLIGRSLLRLHTDFQDRVSTDNSSVSLDRYSGGMLGSEVLFYTIAGGGHTIPSVKHRIGGIAETVVGWQNQDIEAAELIWEFFDGHTRDGIKADELDCTPLAGDAGPGHPIPGGDAFVFALTALVLAILRPHPRT